MKISKNIKKIYPFIIYSIVWLATLLWFGFGISGSDGLAFMFLEFYLILPITSMICSVLIGHQGVRGRILWMTPLFFGLMYMLMGYATFSIENTIAFHKVHIPNVYAMIPGIISSLLGLLTGFAGKHIMGKKAGS